MSARKTNGPVVISRAHLSRPARFIQSLRNTAFMISFLVVVLIGCPIALTRWPSVRCYKEPLYTQRMSAVISGVLMARPCPARHSLLLVLRGARAKCPLTCPSPANMPSIRVSRGGFEVRWPSPLPSVQMSLGYLWRRAERSRRGAVRGFQLTDDSRRLIRRRRAAQYDVMDAVGEIRFCHPSARFPRAYRAVGQE